jgi:hypothetical protein
MKEVPKSLMNKIATTDAVRTLRALNRGSLNHSFPDLAATGGRGSSPMRDTANSPMKRKAPAVGGQGSPVKAGLAAFTPSP